METTQILNEIEKKLKDKPFAREDLLNTLYEGLLYAAAQCRMPDLLETDTVTTVTETDQVELPDDYHHDVYRAYNEGTESFCMLLHNRSALEYEYRHTTVLNGDVESVAPEGNYLVYRFVPETPQTISIEYFRKPERPQDVLADVPEGIPEHLHSSVLVNYVLFQRYSEIEGDNDQRDHVAYFGELLNRGILELKSFFRGVNYPRKKIPRRAFFF